MLRWLSPLVVGLALVAAGCGGSSSTASETTTTTETVTESTTTESTTESTTTGETTTEASGNGSGVSGIPSANCIQAVTAFAALGAAAAGAGAAGANTDTSLSTFQKYADSAPSEIRDDLKVLVTGYVKYIKAVSELGLKQGETPNADQIAKWSKASEVLNTPEIQAASQHWDAWATKNCKQ